MNWVVASVAFGVCVMFVALMLHSRSRWAMDHPNERSLHDAPTPRTGGIGLMAGILAAATVGTVALESVPLAAIALAVMLAGISLADDRRGLPIAMRLGAHALAAGLFAAYLTDNGAPWWWMAGAVLALTAMTNFFNFMDGANGLAGGMAVAGFGCYFMASMSIAPGFAALCLAIAAAAAGFLCFNLPGRVFLGDGGAVPLGFLAAALGLEGWMHGLWPLWFPLLVFAPFIADALITLLRRLVRGERFWEAHREHYYQRLVRSGWSHAKLAAAEYLLMLACAAAALLARGGDAELRAVVFATVTGCLAAAALAIDRRWRNCQAAQEHSR